MNKTSDFPTSVEQKKRDFLTIYNSLTKRLIFLYSSPNFLPFAAFGCSTEKSVSQREKLTLKIQNKKTGSYSTEIGFDSVFLLLKIMATHIPCRMR